MSTDSDSFVLGGATDAPTEINKCLVTPTPGANVIPKFDYQGRLHSVTPEEEWDGSNAVATTEYVDNMISDNMPEIPTNVSELNNDAGYLTQHQDLSNYVQKTNLADSEHTGVVKVNTSYGIGMQASGANEGTLTLMLAGPAAVKGGTMQYRALVPLTQHLSTFYGLSKAAGVDLANEENITVGVYPAGAKAAIQTMLDVPSNAAMNTAIGNAIGNINSFDMAVVQELPTQDISTHTIYLVPKTGETNDVYDEYVYINNAWEMVGNTQIDLSNYATKSEIPNVPVQDVQVNGVSVLNQGVANVPTASTSDFGAVKLQQYGGLQISGTGLLKTDPAGDTHVKAGTDTSRPIVCSRQHMSTFYGLAKAAGDTTQSQSNNAVGTYTNEAHI